MQNMTNEEKFKENLRKQISFLRSLSEEEVFVSRFINLLSFFSKTILTASPLPSKTFETTEYKDP